MARIDCVAYWPTTPGVGIADVKSGLPALFRKELLSGSARADYGIYVDSAKQHIIVQLDSRFGIGRTRDYVKERVLEIDQSYVADYTHFFLAPRTLDHHEDVFFDLMKPACEPDTCPWGARRISTVSIRVEVVPQLGIAQISRLWDYQSVELVVSLHVKQLLDGHGVSGLEYEPCSVTGNCEPSPRVAEPPYLARIVPATYQFGADIIPGTNYCEKHSIALAPFVFGRQTPREAIKEVDFQRIDVIRVRDKDYYYYKSLWIVSQRVLRLLLDHKVSGLTRATGFLDQPFRPLVVG